MLNATIPNQPTYKSNHEETKGLQKQVGELMEKGYVRESMSLCVVPMIWLLRRMGHGGCVLIVEPSRT